MFRQICSSRFLIQSLSIGGYFQRSFLPFPGTVIVNSTGSRKNNRTASPAAIYTTKFTCMIREVNCLRNRSMVENEHNANLLYSEYKPNRKKSIDTGRKKTRSIVPQALFQGSLQRMDMYQKDQGRNFVAYLSPKRPGLYSPQPNIKTRKIHIGIIRRWYFTYLKCSIEEE